MLSLAILFVTIRLFHQISSLLPLNFLPLFHALLQSFLLVPYAITHNAYNVQDIFGTTSSFTNTLSYYTCTCLFVHYSKVHFFLAKTMMLRFHHMFNGLSALYAIVFVSPNHVALLLLCNEFSSVFLNIRKVFSDSFFIHLFFFTSFVYFRIVMNGIILLTRCFFAQPHPQKQSALFIVCVNLCINLFWLRHIFRRGKQLWMKRKSHCISSQKNG